LVAVPLLLSIEYYILGPYSYVRIIDEADSLIPRFLAFRSLLLNFGIFHWFPNLVCGVDSLSNGLAIWRFSTLFLLIKPGWLGYQFFKLAHYYFAAFSMFYFSRRYMKLPLWPSLLAAMFFCMYLDDHLYTSLLLSLFPLVLAILLSIVHYNPVKKYLIVLIVSTFYALACSAANTVPGVVAFLLVWFLLFDTENWVAGSKMAVILFVVILLLNWQILWSVQANLKISHRSLMDYNGLVDSPQLYIESLLRQTILLYLPCNMLIVLIAGFRIRFSTALKKLTTIFVLLELFYVFLPALKILLKEISPAYASYSFHFVQLFTPFWAAALAGESFSILISKAHDTVDSKGANVAAVIIVLCIATALIQNVYTRAVNLGHWSIYGGFAKQFEVKPIEALQESETAPFRACTFNRYLHPSMINAYGIETVDGYANMYSRRYKYFWQYVIDKRIRNDPYYFKYFTHWGNRVYLFRVDDNPVHFDDYYNLNLLSLANTKYVISRFPLVHDNLRLHYWNGESFPPGWNLQSSWRQGQYCIKRIMSKDLPLYIYENTLCFERYYFAGNIVFANDLQTIMRQLSASGIEWLRDHVYIEQKYAAELKNKYSAQSAKVKQVVKNGPDEIHLKVDAPIPTILVIAVNYSPYWTCYTDGAPATVFPANGTFMGVALEGGQTDIRLVYSLN